MSDSDADSDNGSESESDFEVEEILDKKRGKDGEWLYYIKWVGFENDENSWEPVEHLGECKEMVDDFDKKLKEKKQQKLKERKEIESRNAAKLKVEDQDNGSSNLDKKKDKKLIASGSGNTTAKNDRNINGEKGRSIQHMKKKAKRISSDLRPELNEVSKKKGKDSIKERKPKYFKDVKPEKILGVTTEPGELYFYIQWEGDTVEPGLVTAKEAYRKIPWMCLEFYESHLVWKKKIQSREYIQITNKNKENFVAKSVKIAKKESLKDESSVTGSIEVEVPKTENIIDKSTQNIERESVESVTSVILLKEGM